MKLSKTLRQMRLDSLVLISLTAFVGASLMAPARAQKVSDASLDSVRASDRADRLAKAPAQPSAAEHMRRASVYMSNRAFSEARQHWQAVLDNYPNDPSVAPAIFGIGRSLYWERRYEDARQMFERVAQGYPGAKDGREGWNCVASSLLRMGRAAGAAARYVQYLDKYPNGERIETAYLNIV